MAMGNRTGRRGRHVEAAVVVFLAAAFLFLSPAVLAWARADRSWLLPYALWAGVIAAAWWVDWRRGRDGV